jgi:hypothetical protein
MKKCQLKTTFYFADVNDKTVQQTLHALRVQASIAEFIAAHQGQPAAEIQAAFQQLMEKIRKEPPPVAGGHESSAQPQTGTARTAGGKS